MVVERKLTTSVEVEKEKDRGERKGQNERWGRTKEKWIRERKEEIRVRRMKIGAGERRRERAKFNSIQGSLKYIFAAVDG